jgi:hypothetical protein
VCNRIASETKITLYLKKMPNQQKVKGKAWADSVREEHIAQIKPITESSY